MGLASFNANSIPFTPFKRDEAVPSYCIHRYRLSRRDTILGSLNTIFELGHGKASELFLTRWVHKHCERGKRPPTIFNTREAVVDGKKEKISEGL